MTTEPEDDDYYRFHWTAIGMEHDVNGEYVEWRRYTAVRPTLAQIRALVVAEGDAYGRRASRDKFDIGYHAGLETVLINLDRLVLSEPVR